MAQLIFIDTNIFLDFYRARGQESDLSILERIDSNHKRIICTYQVEMEYKKNRQKVINDSLKEIKLGTQISVPAYLRASKPNSAITTSEKSLKKQISIVRDRVTKSLSSPSTSDPVFKCAQRLFKASDPCHLTRTMDIRYEIRELAEKRFKLGYPPRKKNDTSMGDAVNWEWIVHCAEECSDDIIVVSRDGDYGESLGGDSTFINDWLKQEFKQRVSKSRNIALTTRLTLAFKNAGIRVSAKEEAQEESLIEIIQSKRKKHKKTESKFSEEYREYLNLMYDVDA